MMVLEKAMGFLYRSTPMNASIELFYQVFREEVLCGEVFSPL